MDIGDAERIAVEENTIWHGTNSPMPDGAIQGFWLTAKEIRVSSHPFRTRRCC